MRQHGDPFLKNENTSPLALLTDEAYVARLSRIKAAMAKAEADGETLVFPVDLALAMLVRRM